MMPSSRLPVLAAPSIAATFLVCALASCGTSSESSSCPSPDAAVNVDAVAPGDAGGAVLPDAGTDAPAAALGTPGPYFAGTACHCETTIQSQETSTYGQSAQFTNASRSSDGTTCTLHVVTDSNFVLTMHSNGVAEQPAVMSTGIVFSNVGTWRCDRGSFRLEFATRTQTGDLAQQYLIAPPQCQIFPCAPGLRCSINAADPARNACVADGTLSRGVSCNDDASCESGLTCKATSFATFNACQ